MRQLPACKLQHIVLLYNEAHRLDVLLREFYAVTTGPAFALSSCHVCCTSEVQLLQRTALGSS
jgi:hypothetical protein